MHGIHIRDELTEKGLDPIFAIERCTSDWVLIAPRRAPPAIDRRSAAADLNATADMVS